MFQFLSVGFHQATASKIESNSGGQGSHRIARNPKEIKKENGLISARSSGKTSHTNRSEKSESSQQISQLEEIDQNRLLSARSLEIGWNFEELHKNKPSKVPALHLKKEVQIQTQISLLHMNELDQITKLYEESQNKVKNLEDQVHKYEQTISELRFQLQESNQNSEMLDECCKDLKQAYDTLYIDFENIQKDVRKDKNIEEQAEFELQIYKEKVLSLEKELEDLKIRKESVSSKSSIFDASTQEIEELYSNTRSFAHSMYNFPQVGDSKNAKMGWTTADIERYTMRGSVKEHQEKLKVKGERIHFLEIEMSKLKTQIADLINIITEHGGTQLLDKIEDIVSLNQ